MYVINRIREIGESKRKDLNRISTEKKERNKKKMLQENANAECKIIIEDE